MAFCTSAWLQLLSLLLGVSSMDKSGAGGAEEFRLLQPQDAVRVSAGEILTLTCSVTGLGPAGPVKWFKGSGGGRQLVYAERGSFPRVTRAANGSNTDFTIRISDTRPADAGTYRCVKFKKVSGAGEEDKKGSAADEEFRSGAGTAVTVSGEDRHQVAVSAAAGTVCVLLVVLVLVSTYFFVRKKRGLRLPFRIPRGLRASPVMTKTQTCSTLTCSTRPGSSSPSRAPQKNILNTLPLR
nr:signal-regulatory protein beta-1-like isoform X2 [Caretta caretta]